VWRYRMLAFGAENVHILEFGTNFVMVDKVRRP
jgi:hypothetical protein